MVFYLNISYIMGLLFFVSGCASCQYPLLAVNIPDELKPIKVFDEENIPNRKSRKGKENISDDIKSDSVTIGLRKYIINQEIYPLLNYLLDPIWLLDDLDKKKQEANEFVLTQLGVRKKGWFAHVEPGYLLYAYAIDYTTEKRGQILVQGDYIGGTPTDVENKLQEIQKDLRKLCKPSDVKPWTKWTEIKISP